MPCPQGIVAVFSHGDVIRTALAHYLGMPFNEYCRLTLDNGAISVLELCDEWVRIKALNFMPQIGQLWLELCYPTWQKMQALALASGVSSTKPRHHPGKPRHG